MKSRRETTVCTDGGHRDGLNRSKLKTSVPLAAAAATLEHRERGVRGFQALPAAASKYWFLFR